MDATEFADPATVTHGEYGQLTQSQIVRDALGDALRTEAMAWTYYPTGEVDRITAVIQNPGGDDIDDQLIKHYTDKQPEARSVLTVVLAPQDVTGITAPIPGQYRKLIDIGSRAALWAVDAPASVLLDLHAELWGLAPAQTFGVLAVASALDDVFLPAAVRYHTGMTIPEALARRDRIADYLDSIGCDTALLRAAATEHAQMEGIVVALEHTMAQLWQEIR